MPSSRTDMKALTEKIEAGSAFIDAIYSELDRVIIGQKSMLRRLVTALLADGHVLLEGVPGLAKTLAVSSLARVIDTGFQRIQFTPDLLPADLVGTLIFNQKTGDFTVKKGPVFSNIILADEINRSPAKVQSALLEAMQERQVTIGEQTFSLEQPFMVLATQNPIEQEGTYPLPEAQVDRFMFKVKVGYPGADEELEIMRRMAKTGASSPLKKVVSVKKIMDARKLIDNIYMDEKIEQYIVNLVMATRDPEGHDLSKATGLIEYGASPRGSIQLNLAARAEAFCEHRAFVIPEDVRNAAYDILRHRIILTYEAEAEDISSEDIIDMILNKIEVP